MSHFSVLVTKTQDKSVDEQLERFFEQGEDDDYFMERQIEIRADVMQSEAESIVKRFKEAAEKDGIDEEQRAKNQKDYRYMKHLVDNGEFVEVVKEWHGGDIDEDGNLFYLHNPDAKWDWWEVGGRWSGSLKLKDDADAEPKIGGHYSFNEDEVKKLLARRRTDVAKVKDIDWEGMLAEKIEQAKSNWSEYQKSLALPEKERPNPYWEWGIEPNDTEQKYIKRQGSLPFFAVLHDDTWNEAGQMGWWAIVTDRKEPGEWEKAVNEIIGSLDPEDEVTVVDCHI